MKDRRKKRLKRTQQAPSVLGTQIAAMTPVQMADAAEYVIRKLWLDHRARELAPTMAAALSAGPPPGCPRWQRWLFYPSLLLLIAAELGPDICECARLRRQLEFDLEFQRWKRSLEIIREVLSAPAVPEAPQRAPEPVPRRTPPVKKPGRASLEFRNLKRQGWTLKKIRAHPDFRHLNPAEWAKLREAAQTYDRRHRRNPQCR